ncbi:MAG: helicase-related protein, partial [Thermoproteota archaeon]
SLRAMEHEILVSRLKVHAYNTIVDLDTDSFNRVSINDRAQKFAEETVRILEEETKDLDYNLRERIPKTLIVATNVREADKIYQKLKELIPEKSSVIKLAHYKTEYSPSEEVEEFKELSEGILVTVNMADMGFDDRNLETLVIARRIKTPVAYVQIRGRVLRRHVTYDPNSIKKRREYALLVDFTGSVLEHEKQEIVEQVEGGRFSSEGVYADLVGGFREGEVREIEANVEINKLQAFMVPEGESESIVSPEEARKEAKLRKRSLKTILREFNELFDSERRLRRCEELVDNLEEDIEDIERRIRKRREISKNLQDMLMNILLSNFEKQVSSSIEEQEIRKALIENECTIAVLEGILGIQKGIKEVLERMYEQIKSEMSKEHENPFHVRN